MCASVFDESVEDLCINAGLSAEVLLGAAAGYDVTDAGGKRRVLCVARRDNAVAVAVPGGNDTFFVADLGEGKMRFIFRSEIFQHEFCGGEQDGTFRVFRIQCIKRKDIAAAVDSAVIPEQGDQPCDCAFEFRRTDPFIVVRIQKRHKFRIGNGCFHGHGVYRPIGFVELKYLFKIFRFCENQLTASADFTELHRVFHILSLFICRTYCR